MPPCGGAGALHDSEARGCTSASHTSPLPLTYVISLSRRPARRKTALERIAAAGLERYIVFDAVDGRELSLDALRERGVTTYDRWKLEESPCRFFKRELKWGEIGCALSHYGVWELAYASCEAAVLVVEDDVDFVPGFASKLAEAMEEVAAAVSSGATSCPDLLYLTRHALTPAIEKEVFRQGAPGESCSSCCLLLPAFSYKTTAYVLWREGARKLLESGFLRKLIPVDDFLNVLFYKHEIDVALARPDLDALFADSPRIHALAVRPQVCVVTSSTQIVTLCHPTRVANFEHAPYFLHQHEHGTLLIALGPGPSIK